MNATLPIGTVLGPDLDREIEDELLIAQGDALLARLEEEREEKEVLVFVI